MRFTISIDTNDNEVYNMNVSVGESLVRQKEYPKSKTTQLKMPRKGYF